MFTESIRNDVNNSLTNRNATIRDGVVQSLVTKEIERRTGILTSAIEFSDALANAHRAENNQVTKQVQMVNGQRSEVLIRSVDSDAKLRKLETYRTRFEELVQATQEPTASKVEWNDLDQFIKDTTTKLR